MRPLLKAKAPVAKQQQEDPLRCDACHVRGQPVRQAEVERIAVMLCQDPAACLTRARNAGIYKEGTWPGR